MFRNTNFEILIGKLLVFTVLIGTVWIIFVSLQSLKPTKR